jgi:ATP-dependent RNA helicase RhlE
MHLIDIEPSSTSMQSFEGLGLHAKLLSNIDAEGYKIPTPIQEKAIPLVLEEQDLIALAQTGTGKTAAFVLPILQKLKYQDKEIKHQGDRRPRPVVRALVLAPTRELANQIHEVFVKLGKNTELPSITLYGGNGKVGVNREARELQKGKDIIIACPGRILDHLKRGNISLNKVKMLVLDEADQMLEKGFERDLVSIIKQLPEEKQSLLF